MTITPMSYLNPRVIGRSKPGAAQPYFTTGQLETYLLEQFLDREWNHGMIHKPAGWVNTMSCGDWHGMPDGYAAVYASCIGQVLAERPGYQVTVYGGFQYHSAFSIYGRPRADRPYQMADPSNRQHVRGLRDLTVQPWADLGVTGWVFDMGSKDPDAIRKWKRVLRRIVPRVGLEAIPWDDSRNRVDWKPATRYGLEYHALTRFRDGKPFVESVPDGVTAYVWINHDPIPTVEELVALMQRGWTPMPNVKYDKLVKDALSSMDSPAVKR